MVDVSENKGWWDCSLSCGYSPAFVLTVAKKLDLHVSVNTDSSQQDYNDFA